MDGRAVHLTGRQRALLATLLLEPGRVMPTERLADWLWGESLPPSSVPRIRALVAEVRRALGPRGDSIIVTQSPGYLARVMPGELDVAEFTALVERARHAGAEAVPIYDRALAMWRGEPFPDLTGLAAQAERSRLVELRVEAAERRAELLLERGHGEDVVADLRKLVAEQPLRERPHGLLMRALHGSGRLPEALTVYRDLRARLVRELGVEPSTELRDLHQRLLKGDVRPQWIQTPHQIPHSLARFVGRAEALRRLDAAHRVAVVGPAGVGKTALVVHWAHRAAEHFPDGQLFVDMRGFGPASPRSLPEALTLLLQGLGLTPADIPVDVDAQIALYRTRLTGRRMLVVLDDVADPRQVRELLTAPPGCRIVITSRDRLSGLVAVDGVERITLDALDDDEALHLLTQAVGPARARRDPDAAAELLRLCGRLPLALSIATSWIGEYGHRTVGDCVHRLTARGRMTGLSVEGDENVAVRAALDASYEALPADAQRMFRLLALAPGSTEISVAAAAALAETSRAEAEELLGTAARIHLIEESGPGRFAAHDLVLEYAAQRGREADAPTEREAAVRRLLDHYLHLLVAATEAGGFQTTQPPRGEDRPFDDPAEAAAWFDGEWQNLAAAVSHTAVHGPRRYAWLLVESAQELLHHRATLGERLRVAGIGLEAAEQEQDLRGQSAMRLVLGTTRWRMADLEEALRESERALALSRQAGWEQGEAMALLACGVTLKRLGQPDRAIPHYRRAVALHRASGNVHGEVRGLGNLASAYLVLGRLDQAEECLRAALPLARESGDRHMQSLTLVNLGLVRQQQARFAEAVEVLEEALTVSRTAGLRYAEGVAHETLGLVHCDAGRPEQAIAAFTAALDIAESVENRNSTLASLVGLAEAELRLGRADGAFARLGAARRFAEESGMSIGQVLLGLARAEHHVRHHDRARELATQALTLSREHSPLDVPRLHALLAEIHLADGAGEESARESEQAASLAARSGQRLEQARALLVLGHAQDQAGDRQGARGSWRQAHDLFTAIGAPEERLTASLLRRMPDDG
ncbi:AfsR/SARP family transcriptional regulator [Nonomuraea sp. SYSU D8015]|uniref:AfsR/SARP family transcriptional regulator n=1 Tax=Nonomuraea sp. SYSU D8015 TaxID=2593644 RepID=UPI00166105B5|nr:BTAD domain-containing putative transcriptional regulator [Nonomuraea sp. SYSU D8015]